jgi:hypothetical protein
LLLLLLPLLLLLLLLLCRRGFAAKHLRDNMCVNKATGWASSACGRPTTPRARSSARCSTSATWTTTCASR